MTTVHGESGAIATGISCDAGAGDAGLGTDGSTVDTEGDIYGHFYPYYAELCALSEIRKKPGFGVPLRSGMGGHSVLYLNGVGRDREAGYPMLRVCNPDASPARHGVGISVNSHYKNANWIAAEGRDFVWRGALARGEHLTRDVYMRTQQCAKTLGFLDGVEFHHHLFAGKPKGMAIRDYMYELSVASDYALCFGRNVYRARVPLDHRQMTAIVAFLNDLNAPYRDGSRVFQWRVLNNNCSHVAHNALAAAGIWAPWPTGQFFALAAFKFPVPKNEFVDLVLRTNDLPIEDPDTIYRDEIARNLLLRNDMLPTVPGALAIATPVIPDNDIYVTERLRLIFYDNPFWGPYRQRFLRIFSDPRYVDLRANLDHFAQVYKRALARRRGAPEEMAAPYATRARSPDHTRFYAAYDRYIAQALAGVTGRLARLDSKNESSLEVIP